MNLDERIKSGWVSENVYVGPHATDQEMMILAIAILEDLQKRMAEGKVDISEAVFGRTGIASDAN